MSNVAALCCSNEAPLVRSTIYRLRPELHSLFFALFELVKFTNSEITSERDAIDETGNINERRTKQVVSEKDSRIFSKSLEKIQQRGKPV